MEFERVKFKLNESEYQLDLLPGMTIEQAENKDLFPKGHRKIKEPSAAAKSPKQKRGKTK